MERLQGPINPCIHGEHLNVDSYSREESSLSSSYGAFVNARALGSQEGQHFFSTPTLQDQIPFLEMLQSVESPPFSPFTEPNFELLLRLERKKFLSEMDCRIQALELESCITHDISEAQSPVKSETKENRSTQISSCTEVVSSVCNLEPIIPEKPGKKIRNLDDRNPLLFDEPSSTSRERRKRKRNRPNKNREEVESQRMTHIAVERNRRRQMNDHLNALRSLMPTSFVQRGDQASIIGGAIDFVKELEQLLQSLIAQKSMRRTQQEEPHKNDAFVLPLNGFFTSPQHTSYSDINHLVGENEFTIENKSAIAGIQVIVIQTHVNLKILSPSRPGQLLKAITALEDLRLTILHLNVTTLECSVFYSFSLKIEDDCKLGTAEEIGKAVHQIFSFINGY